MGAARGEGGLHAGCRVARPQPRPRNEYGQYNGRPHGEDDAPSRERAEVQEPACVPDDDRPSRDDRVRRPIQRPADELLGERRGESVLRVGKALSVRTRSFENEQGNKNGGERDLVWVGGRQYRKSTVAGELSVSNHRKQNVQLLIRRRFSPGNSWRPRVRRSCPSGRRACSRSTSGTKCSGPCL